MYTINIFEDSAKQCELWPTPEILEDYEDGYSFSGFASTLGVECMMGEVSRFRMAEDSNVYAEVRPTGNKGTEGIEEFKDSCRKLYELISRTMKSTKGSTEWMEGFLKDFDENGVTMPIYGKII